MNWGRIVRKVAEQQARRAGLEAIRSVMGEDNYALGANLADIVRILKESHDFCRDQEL